MLVVKEILDANRDVLSATDGDGRTAVHLAALYRQADALRLLVAAEGVNLEATTMHGEVATLSAVAQWRETPPRRWNDPECLRLLTEAGANPNGSTLPGAIPPLVSAASFGLDRLVEHLLSVPATNVNVVANGKNALQWASTYNRAKCVDLLRPHFPEDDEPAPPGTPVLSKDDLKPISETDRKRLAAAAAAAAAESAAAAAAGGGAVSPTSPSTWDPATRRLHHKLLDGARRGRAQDVTDALDAGADIRATDTDGRTSLNLACLFRQPATVKLLLQRGADPATPNIYGEYGVHSAAVRWKEADIDRADDPKCLQMLLDAGADPNVAMADGTTPLISASAFGYAAGMRACGVALFPAVAHVGCVVMCMCMCMCVCVLQFGEDCPSAVGRGRQRAATGA